MEEEKRVEEDVLDLAIQNEYENSGSFAVGTEQLTKSNSTIAALYKAKADILKSQTEAETEANKIEAEKEIKLAEIEAEERRDKRQTLQRYVGVGAMVAVAGAALFADSDSWIGRVNKGVFNLATKVIFRG